MMKNETMGASLTPNKKEQKELMNDSKELNPVDQRAENHHRSFGVLDMWNLQKRQRTAASMLRRLQ